MMSQAYPSSQVSTAVQTQYHLIHAIYVLLDDGDRRVLQQFGLTLAQYRVLLLLDPEHGQRLTTISERLLRAKSTITRIVDQLEYDGLVARSSDTEDRRAQRVVLTPAGADVLQRARAVHEEKLAQRFALALPEEDQEDFIALLTRFHDSLVDSLNTLGAPVPDPE